jgi:general secretion pathway protein E
MGVEPFLLGSAIRAVQAQRLVRRLCQKCAVAAEPAQSILNTTQQLFVRAPHLATGEPRWRIAKGCPECRGSGYRGRLGIFEFLEVTPPIQESVMRQDPVSALLAIAQGQGYRSLREDGLVKARRGLTSVDEVLRVTGLSAVAEPI